MGQSVGLIMAQIPIPKGISPYPSALAQPVILGPTLVPRTPPPEILFIIGLVFEFLRTKKSSSKSGVDYRLLIDEDDSHFNLRPNAEEDL